MLLLQLRPFLGTIGGCPWATRFVCCFFERQKKPAPLLPAYGPCLVWARGPSQILCGDDFVGKFLFFSLAASCYIVALLSAISLFGTSVHLVCFARFLFSLLRIVKCFFYS